MQHHKYSLTELENMLPWEREVYVSLLVNYLKEEKERREKKTEKIMAEEIKDVKVATPKQKVQVDLEVDTSNQRPCKSICKINSYAKQLTLENISKIIFNSLHNSIIQMRNLVYGLTAPTMEQSGLISIVVGAGAAWFGLYTGTSKKSK